MFSLLILFGCFCPHTKLNCPDEICTVFHLSWRDFTSARKEKTSSCHTYTGSVIHCFRYSSANLHYWIITYKFKLLIHLLHPEIVDVCKHFQKLSTCFLLNVRFCLFFVFSWGSWKLQKVLCLHAKEVFFFFLQPKWSNKRNLFSEKQNCQDLLHDASLKVRNKSFSLLWWWKFVLQ